MPSLHRAPDFFQQIKQHGIVLLEFCPQERAEVVAAGRATHKQAIASSKLLF